MNLRETRLQSERMRSGRYYALAVLLTFLVVQKAAPAAKIVFVDTQAGASAASRQIAEAATFYGLNVETRIIKKGDRKDAVLQAMRAGKPVAVVVAASALPLLDAQRIRASSRQDQREIPLFIVGIDEHTDGELLKSWSGGEVIGSKRAQPGNTEQWYRVTSQREVVRQLADSKLPMTARSFPYLLLADGQDGLIEAQWKGESQPVFAKSRNGKTFFATEIEASPVSVSADPYRQQAVFAQMAATMIFLSYAAGERAWHNNAEYANFTIDDLWLREPYGHVNYEELLKQSELHNFHTTVAFIPWNFDRNEAAVASLFRANPARFSICIHGNDHVHQEFGPLDAHPIEKQTADLKQGLARMEKFRELTGIPYDAVMVFPHSVSPEGTFEELRRYNYLATANSLNVPSDAVAPADTEFALRTGTLRFGGFASLRRYSAETEIPSAQLAIDAFLGNPMLFYAHESFFAEGMEAFNSTADLVNRLEPSTQWRGLGDIVRHLYVERLRNDGDYDIRTYSGTIDITNRHGHDAVFYIEKYEPGAQAFTVSVDGEPLPMERSGSNLRFRVAIPSGATRAITLRYVNDFNLASIDIAKHSLRTHAIRLLSDFRDNVVSRSGMGRRFIRSYANNGLLWNLAMITTAILAGVAMISRLWRRAVPETTGAATASVSRL